MQKTGEKFIDFDGTFFLGVQSDLEPGQLPLGHAWMCLNMLNLGGVLTCRPGYQCLVTFPTGRLQGAFLFRPIAGLEQMLVAIAGQIWVADYPFLQFHLVPNIQLSPDARQVFFCQAYQSAQRNTPGSLTSAITVIPTKSIAVIQDGGVTAPAWYDGFNSGHIQGNLFGTPAGGQMVWVGDRLWVQSGNLVFASDAANPFSFVEQIYLGGLSAFVFASEVTAMVITPSIESPQLMVFTGINGSILQANIRDRNSWPSIPNFQEEVIQVGCLAAKSAISHFGRLVWYGPGGFSFFDPAMSGKITTRLPVRDNEMLYSKVTVDDDTSLACAAAFGQFLLLSVPGEDIYNKHTWVLNHASLTSLNDDSGPSWSGYWVGTRPVEWVYGIIAGQERIYHVSVDNDGQNRLWEAFRPNFLDNGCPITWAVFTRGYFGFTAQMQAKPPGELCRLRWADVALAGIAEDLDLGVFYAPGTSGSFKSIMTKTIRVKRGVFDSNRTVNATDILFALKAQSRTVRTEDADIQNIVSDDGCPVEKDDNPAVDTHFQLLIVGHGPASIRYIRPLAATVPPKPSGDPRACQSETMVNAVRFDGAGVSAVDLNTALQTLQSDPIMRFTSAQTALLNYRGLSAVGVGFAESIVSQAAADRVANRIATQFASQNIISQLPSVYSVGLV